MASATAAADLSTGDRRIGAPLLLSPIVIYYGLFLVLPYLFMFYLSIQKYDPVELFTNEFTAENYLSVLGDPFYVSLLFSTIWLGIFVTAVTLLMGYPLAVTISNTKGRTKTLLMVLVLSPLLVNLVVRSYAWLVLLGDNGVINSLVMASGLIDDPLPINRNFISVSLGLIHISLPLMVLSLVAIMDRFDRSIFEAARSLGAGELRILRKLHLPMALPGIGAGSLLVFCTVISTFVTPQLLGGHRYSTISTVIYQKFTFSLNWPLGATLAFILLAINAVVIFAHGMFFRERGSAAQ